MWPFRKSSKDTRPTLRIPSNPHDAYKMGYAQGHADSLALKQRCQHTRHLPTEAPLATICWPCYDQRARDVASGLDTQWETAKGVHHDGR